MRFTQLFKISLAILSMLCSLRVGAQTPAQSTFEKSSIQIGVVVRDLRKSIAFYTNILGMKETGAFSLDSAFGSSSGLTGGLPVDVIVLKLVDAPDATEWKLMSFDGKTEQNDSKHIQDATGMRYITIFVKSVKPYLKKLKEHNIPMLGQTPVRLNDGRSFILIQDPDGIFIEIIGPDSV